MEHLQQRLETRIKDICRIYPIEKGFSQEKKFQIQTNAKDLLLRIAPLDALSRKQEEFGIMKQLFAEGVRCNCPVEMFTEDDGVYSLFHYLPGDDAETAITGIPDDAGFKAGVQAGRDLKKINTLERPARNWKSQKLEKHDRYVAKYRQMGCHFPNDDKVLDFIRQHWDQINPGNDRFLHDDFHLGNIVMLRGVYSGILDFNRYDWGDPLHEFVKLEWFTWPVCEAFARGQIKGYFGDRGISDADCLTLSVYIAMSIFSTIVWTQIYHPHTMPSIRAKVDAILTRYRCFDQIRPKWGRAIV